MTCKGYTFFKIRYFQCFICFIKTFYVCSNYIGVTERQTGQKFRKKLLLKIHFEYIFLLFRYTKSTWFKVFTSVFTSPKIFIFQNFPKLLTK